MIKKVIITVLVAATISGAGIATNTFFKNSSQKNSALESLAAKEAVSNVDATELLSAEETSVSTDSDLIKDDVVSEITEAEETEVIDVNITTESIEEVSTEDTDKILTPLAKSYTNQYIPGLSINYTTDWAFDTSTEQLGNVEGLLDRKVTLTKGETVITFTLFPGFGTGCGGMDAFPEGYLFKFRENINNSGINRYDTFTGQGDIYANQDSGVHAYCLLSYIFSLESNIPTSNFPSITGNHGETVNYWMVVDVSGSEHLSEADNIIAQSKLGDNFTN